MSSKSQKSLAAKKSKTSSRGSASNKSQHVVPDRGGWAVKAAGSSRAAGTYATQAEAIEAAKKAASRNAEVIIHSRNGRIRQTISRSRADELMLRAWKGLHAESSATPSGTRKAG